MLRKAVFWNLNKKRPQPGRVSPAGLLLWLIKMFKHHLKRKNGDIYCLIPAHFFSLTASSARCYLQYYWILRLSLNTSSHAACAHPHMWRRRFDIFMAVRVALHRYCVKRGQQSENVAGLSSHTQSFSGISQPRPFCSFKTAGGKATTMTKGRWINPCRRKNLIIKGPLRRSE